MISSAVASGIMAMGCDVMFLGVVPTPALQYFVKTHDDVCGGVMITASHNPPEFNGIKCISADGTEASAMEESMIEDAYSRELEGVEWSKVGEVRDITGAGEAYIDAIISKVDAEAIREAGLTVVLDCANGAAFETTPLLLKKLGVRAVTLNCNPQGEFPGHNSEPTEDNLTDLMSLVHAMGANLGIAHDGDADRCVFIDDKGTYVPGDKTLALISKSILDSNPGGVVVTPVATSSLVKEIVESNGGRLITTAVGSPVVARTMIKEDGVFGGEENGGLIFPDMQFCRDGGMAIARMLEAIISNGPLSEQLSVLPVYHTVKSKLHCPNNMKSDLAMHFATSVDDDVTVDTTDGVKLIYDDGWVLLRASGTEPLFRVYSESKDRAVAESRAQKYLEMAEGFVNGPSDN
jgi:phosphomannomutase/phosphoglucomutase